MSSGPPNRRYYSEAELTATSRKAAENAQRRALALETRLAVTEQRLAEAESTIAELTSGFQAQAEATSGVSVVVRELEQKVTAGPEAVLAAISARVTALEHNSGALPQAMADFDALTLAIERRLEALESKRRPGRPRGSKNKPKEQAEPTQNVATKEEV